MPRIRSNSASCSMRSPICSSRFRFSLSCGRPDIHHAGEAMTRLLVALLLLMSFGAAPMAGAQGQGVTLDFPSWQAEEPGFGEWWKGLIQEYEAKHPGVKVKLYSIPFANYVNQLTVRFA